MAKADRVGEAMARLKKDGIRYVRFEQTDLHGTSRSKLVPLDAVEGYARKGLNFYGGVIALDTASHVVPGTGLHEEINYRDTMLFPDFDTLVRVPWMADTAKVICDLHHLDGSVVGGGPRSVLKSLLAEAASLGFDVMTGHEFEFYLLDKDTKAPLFEGLHIFNSLRNNWTGAVQELLDHLQALGVELITHNCEYASSQFEINYKAAVGIAAADRAFTFKNAVKEVMHRAGLLASFMSKPFPGGAGCGCHVHMSLLDRKTGKNAFLDPKDPDGLSAVARAFIAGLVKHARAMMPLIGPTPNCYHRIKPHTFAPSNISWGIEDRTALVRVKATRDQGTHVEMRGASANTNPYLTAAAVLAAGLLGIKEKLKLGPATNLEGPSEENGKLEKLPQNLEAALDGLESDKAMRALLGEDFIKVFTVVKRYELARFRGHVTDWERNEYLEVY